MTTVNGPNEDVPMTDREYYINPILRYGLDMREVITKTYSHKSDIINYYTINEASMLSYMNEMNSIHAPIFYTTISSMLLDGSMESKLIHQGAGYSLAEWTANMNFDATCKFVSDMLPSISNALDNIHEYGVIHNNPSADNVWIDNEGEVQLVNFDLATYTDYIDPYHPRHQYLVPGNDSYSPSTPTDDSWLLGVHLLNLCLSKLGHEDYLIPILASEVSKMKNHIIVGRRPITDEEFAAGNSDNWRIAGLHLINYGNLDVALSQLLQFNFLYRVGTAVSERALHFFNDGNLTITYNEFVKNSFRSYIHIASRGMNANVRISASTLLIGLDVIRRCANMNFYQDISSNKLGLATYLITCRYQSQDTFDQFLTGDSSYTDYDYAKDLSIDMLNHLNWKVYTPDNCTILTSTINESELITIIRRNQYSIINYSLDDMEDILLS